LLYFFAPEQENEVQNNNSTSLLDKELEIVPHELEESETGEEENTP